jgi:hypothetical protein
VGFSDPNLCGRHRQITANHDVDVRLNDGERVREVPVDFFLSSLANMRDWWHVHSLYAGRR